MRIWFSNYRRLRVFMLPVLLISLAGCQDAGDASTLGFSDEGTAQVIHVSSVPPGAACTLSRVGIPIGTVAATPAPISVVQTENDITVSCAAPGYAGSAIIRANVGNSATAGFLSGGLVDVHVYPDSVTVTMTPSAASQPAATPALPPRFGIEVRRGAPGIMNASNQPEAGAFIQGVIKGSLAEQSGLVPGDIITRFNGIEIDTGAALLSAIAAAPGGQPIEFEVLRAGYRIDLTVTF